MERSNSLVADLLAEKGITPGPRGLAAVERKYEEIQGLRGEVPSSLVNDADIALRNIPGGDHVG